MAYFAQRMNTLLTLEAWGVTGGGTTPTPSAPTNLRATAVTSSTLTLAWNATTGSYTLQRAPVDGNGTVGTFQTVYTGTTKGYQDAGLTYLTTYAYQVKVSVNGVESGYSAVVQLTTASTSTTLPYRALVFEDNGAWHLLAGASRTNMTTEIPFTYQPPAGTSVRDTALWQYNGIGYFAHSGYVDNPYYGTCIVVGKFSSLSTSSQVTGTALHQIDMTLPGRMPAVPGYATVGTTALFFSPTYVPRDNGRVGLFFNYQPDTINSTCYIMYVESKDATLTSWSNCVLVTGDLIPYNNGGGQQSGSYIDQFYEYYNGEHCLWIRCFSSGNSPDTCLGLRLFKSTQLLSGYNTLVYDLYTTAAGGTNTTVTARMEGQQYYRNADGSITAIVDAYDNGGYKYCTLQNGFSNPAEFANLQLVGKPSGATYKLRHGDFRDLTLTLPAVPADSSTSQITYPAASTAPLLDVPNLLNFYRFNADYDRGTLDDSTVANRRLSSVGAVLQNGVLSTAGSTYAASIVGDQDYFADGFTIDFNFQLRTAGTLGYALLGGYFRTNASGTSDSPPDLGPFMPFIRFTSGTTGQLTLISSLADGTPITVALPAIDFGTTSHRLRGMWDKAAGLLKLRLDGGQYATTAMTSITSFVPDPHWGNASPARSGSGLDGTLDNIQVWTKATEQDAVTLYAALVSGYTGGTGTGTGGSTGGGGGTAPSGIIQDTDSSWQLAGGFRREPYSKASGGSLLLCAAGQAGTATITLPSGNNGYDAWFPVFNGLQVAFNIVIAGVTYVYDSGANPPASDTGPRTPTVNGVPTPLPAGATTLQAVGVASYNTAAYLDLLAPR